MRLNTIVNGDIRVEAFTKMIPVLWTYDIQDKAKIYDKCGYEVAEVESEFVAHEIASILNHYEEITECLENALTLLEERGFSYQRGANALERCKEIYNFEMPKVELEDGE